MKEEREERTPREGEALHWSSRWFEMNASTLIMSAMIVVNMWHENDLK